MKHAEWSGFPVNKITEIHKMIDPTSATGPVLQKRRRLDPIDEDPAPRVVFCSGISGMLILHKYNVIYVILRLRFLI